MFQVVNMKEVVIMAQCPDCDGVKIFGLNEGDGKCFVCHGDGKGDLIDRFAESFGGSSKCWKCNGSGECPTCGGTGVVDDD
jgi:DnaJ-class molecular chaperone